MYQISVEMMILQPKVEKLVISILKVSLIAMCISFGSRLVIVCTKMQLFVCLHLSDRWGQRHYVFRLLLLLLLLRAFI